MAGYLIRVNYKVLGISKFVMFGVDTGIFPDQATAIANAVSHVTSYRAGHGETITNVSTLVSATR